MDYSSLSKRVGLAAIGTAGLLSAISTCGLLCYIFYCVTVGANRNPLTTGVRSFVRTALGKYLVALLLSECIQGSGFAMNYHWAAIGNMYESPMCVAQATVSQFGDFGSALFSLAITFHTFWLLFLQRKPADWVCWITLLTVGIVMLLLPILGSTVIPKSHGRAQFWGSSGAWCWIGEHYQVERYLFVYMWIFINLFFSGVLYTLIYLKFKGVIEYDSAKREGERLVFHGWRSTTRRWNIRPGASQLSSHNESEASDERGGSTHVSKSLVKIARRLMWYPIVYAMVVVPVSVCRLGVIGGWEPPFWLYAFSGVCFSSSGLTNTLLFIFTRHAFIQRMARPSGIRITTHKLTVTTDADNVQRAKRYSLDELRTTASTPGLPNEGMEYSVQFDAEVAKHKANSDYEGQTMRDYAI